MTDLYGEIDTETGELPEQLRVTGVPDPPDADRGGAFRVSPDVVDENALLRREGELAQGVEVDLRLRLQGADLERESDGVEEGEDGHLADVPQEVPLVGVGEQAEPVLPLEGTDQPVRGLEGGEDVGESIRELLGRNVHADPADDLPVELLRGDFAALVPGVEAGSVDPVPQRLYVEPGPVAWSFARNLSTSNEQMTFPKSKMIPRITRPPSSDSSTLVSGNLPADSAIRNEWTPDAI